MPFQECGAKNLLRAAAGRPEEWSRIQMGHNGCLKASGLLTGSIFGLVFNGLSGLIGIPADP